jgi:hypothetical protein
MTIIIHLLATLDKALASIFLKQTCFYRTQRYNYFDVTIRGIRYI